MDKPDDLVDRDREWRKLRELTGAKGSQLVFMTGRRRVGKSWILQRFARDAGGLYFQATRGTRREQLGRFSRTVGHFFDDPTLKAGAVLSGWEDVFGILTEKSAGRRLLVVLDEFPYLAGEDSSLTSVLQAIWDRDWRESGEIVLVLCGSHITFMRQLEQRDQPLFGRRTARLHVSPFTYREVPEFVPNYSHRERIATWGVFGGLAGNLDQLDPERSLGENTANLVLDPTSRLHDEATHVVDAFGRDSVVPYSVLFAIATGASTWGEIKTRVGRSEGALWPVLEWLQEMELVSRDVPTTKDQPARSKISLYRLTDPYLRFWYRFVQPLYTTGSAAMVDPLVLWAKMIEPRLPGFLGRVFEDVCRDAVRTGLALPFQPLRVGSWWTRDGKHEVDVVARGMEDELFVGECKWGRVSPAELQKLKERGRLVAAEIGGVTRLVYGLFSAAEDGDAEVKDAVNSGDALYFGPEELFAPPA